MSTRPAPRAARSTDVLASRHALAAWTGANRAACEAEAALLRAELLHLRGEAPAPDADLRTHAAQLRKVANRLREYSVIDFVRPLEPLPWQQELAADQWPGPRARSSAASALAAPSPERTEVADERTR